MYFCEEIFVILLLANSVSWVEGYCEKQRVCIPIRGPSEVFYGEWNEETECCDCIGGPEAWTFSLTPVDIAVMTLTPDACALLMLGVPKNRTTITTMALDFR
jgi:hypothetical protein